MGKPQTTTPTLRPVTDQKIKQAPLYKVLIHNDVITPMDFVIAILCNIFHKHAEEAFNIMLTAHNTGVSLVTVLPLEQAELRVDQAHSKARTAKYPLTFTYEQV